MRKTELQYVHYKKTRVPGLLVTFQSHFQCNAQNKLNLPQFKNLQRLCLADFRLTATVLLTEE